VHSKALDAHIKEGVRLSGRGLGTEFRSVFENIRSALIDVRREVEALHPILFGMVKKIDAGSYRIGGEEFIILTPNTSQDHAAILADKVRMALEDHDFDAVGQVTVSMGCVQFDKEGEDDAAKMFKRADEALYRAKEDGRNRVVVSD
jgi:diguanylate cyclase (GGDEF)-like protein